MRIAQVAPIVERVPPKRYGGTERVVYTLTEELVKRGHEVTLFASGDSITSAKLISVCPKALREVKVDNMYGANAWNLLNIGLTYKNQDKFDVIHDHINGLSLPTANLSETPVVMTMHGAFNINDKKLFQSLGQKVNFVSISNSQQESLPDINWAGTVYHGMDMADYPFSEEHDGYLLFVGRITRDKGVHLAIETAQFLNLPLIIAAKLEEASPTDVQYFEEKIKPKLSADIRWIGEVNEFERNKLMSRALCVLHPTLWKEPFGLVLIEALGCGTPVVAIGNGSIPEIIQNGRVGFVVKDLEQMVAAVANIHKISRQECRNYVLENFSVEKMVDGYEEIYKKILAKKKLQPTSSKYQFLD